VFWLTAAIGAVVGNIASVYMSFKGGKGVGTSLGALFGIYPYLTFPGVLAALVWLIVVSVSKYVSLASMVATAAMPFLFVALSLAFDWGVRAHLSLLLLCVVLAILVLLRHKDNIRRLMTGTENRVGSAHPISRQE
jgi:glycerol-3-phosphate acyltransferase PlsY